LIEHLTVAHATEGDRVRSWSRNGRDWSAEFVAITAALRELPAGRIDERLVREAEKLEIRERTVETRRGSLPALLPRTYRFASPREAGDDNRCYERGEHHGNAATQGASDVGCGSTAVLEKHDDTYQRLTASK
jgi:hypothetical protein